jgi:putative alpha-1,2-mannosidase
MIHDEICTYEVAKLAKEKGSDESKWFNNACDRYRQIFRETEGNMEERKRRLNNFRAGYDTENKRD